MTNIKEWINFESSTSIEKGLKVNGFLYITNQMLKVLVTGGAGFIGSHTCLS